ncbi:hypothetical protein C0989_002347 [Termitomyces sp. Mn162]|nr:hypothetical protein C0989_002347 [Termitomyces sp. Mn162]
METKEECWAQVQKHTAICACSASPFPFFNLDFLHPLPLAFLHREALYEDNQSSGRAPEEECGGEFGGTFNLDFLDKAVEVGDWIYGTTLYLPLSTMEIWVSQTRSQQLAQVFAANPVPQKFQDIIPPYLHAFEDVFSKVLFNLLPECK